MAFGDLKKYNLDQSDLLLWKRSNCTKLLVEQIEAEKARALGRLLKDGEKRHSENAECYKAFNKVIKMIDDA